MVIFPEIDKKKTKQNAREVLKRYRQLIRMADKEKIPQMTSSYTFDGIKDSEEKKRVFEVTLTRKSQAEQELQKITNSINQLSLFERQLIYDKFIESQETNVSLYLKYHISESKFYRELDKALIHFAESYDQGQLIELK